MTREPKPKIVATYDYHDADGKLLYQVCRMDPKDFRVRRPGQTKDWIWNLQGVQKVLYRLPKIRAAKPEEIIYKVEGEKDVDRLEKEGKVATTNPGGANKWQSDYSEQLQGHPLVIIPDNDEAGRNHAEKVATASHGVAGSVKIVVLPDLPPKGDVSDWLDAGHTIDELDQLVEATAEWQPPKNKPKKTLPKKKKSKQEKPVFSAHFEGLVDLAWHEGGVVFLLKDGNGVSIKRAVLRNGVTLVPPPADKIPWKLVRANEVIKHYVDWQKEADQANRQLYSDLAAYHAGVSELPDERYYDLLTLFDFHTYLPEFTQYSPIICFFAVAERGKTRTMKGITYVAYRGVRLVSLREAYVFRLAENLRATLLLDLMDVWQVAKRNNCEDILLNRFERDSKVARVLEPDKGAFLDTHYYEVFGPTVIGTNRSLHQILDTRAITIVMRESTKSFNGDVSEENARSLRERLTAFRGFYLGQLLPQVEKPVRGRLGDITRPLRQIVSLVSPDREQAFLELCEEVRDGSIQEKAETLEGQIIKIILDSDSLVMNGILPIKAIAEAYNEDIKPNFHLSNQRVGQIVKSLGFYTGKHRPRMPDGSAALPWNESLINRLAESYGLQPSETSEITEEADISEQSEVSDDVELESSVNAPCKHSSWAPLKENYYRCNICGQSWHYLKDKEEATL